MRENYFQEGNFWKPDGEPYPVNIVHGTGSIIRYYVSGQKRVQTALKDRKIHGDILEWHENGPLRCFVTRAHSPTALFSKAHRDTLSVGASCP